MQHVNLGCGSDDPVLITSCATCSFVVMLHLLCLDLCIASDCDSQILLQLQEFQERQKKIADMEAKLKDKDDEVATRQERIKELHVSNVAWALTSLARPPQEMLAACACLCIVSQSNQHICPSTGMVIVAYCQLQGRIGMSDP